MSEQRLSRITALLGEDAVSSLSSRFVVIVGAGAVGGYAIEALARSGIGHFRIVDGDRFEATNLNRQILALNSTLGQSKVSVAKARIEDISSGIDVQALDLFVDGTNLDAVLEGKIDLVVDAIDSVGPKCLLLEECVKRGIPVVSSMGAALRKDPSMIRTADIGKTFGCPLAKAVRSQLRKDGITSGIMTVFSPEEVPASTGGTLGSLPTVTGVFGLTLANIALEKLVSMR